MGRPVPQRRCRLISARQLVAAAQRHTDKRVASEWRAIGENVARTSLNLSPTVASDLRRQTWT